MPHNMQGSRRLLLFTADFTDGPITIRCCPRCVLAPIRALRRFHAIYTSNRTRKATNWRVFVEISTNTRECTERPLYGTPWSCGSAYIEATHSAACPSLYFSRICAHTEVTDRQLSPERARSRRSLGSSAHRCQPRTTTADVRRGDRASGRAPLHARASQPAPCGFSCVCVLDMRTTSSL